MHKSCLFCGNRIIKYGINVQCWHIDLKRLHREWNPRNADLFATSNNMCARFQSLHEVVVSVVNTSKNQFNLWQRLHMPLPDGLHQLIIKGIRAEVVGNYKPLSGIAIDDLFLTPCSVFSEYCSIPYCIGLPNKCDFTFIISGHSFEAFHEIQRNIVFSTHTYPRCFVWNVVSYPCLQLQRGLTKLPMKLGYGWVIMLHCVYGCNYLS